MAEHLVEISFRAAGGGFDDFYPFELSLIEGFSLVFKGELTVLSAKDHKQEDLAALLDHAASLSVKELLAAGNKTRTRFVHGIITGISKDGVYAQSSKDRYYRYSITIEGDMARLRHTSRSQFFDGKTPPEIIKQILGEYAIDAQFSYIKQDYIKNTNYAQINESDFCFIKKLSSMYGISWAYQHLKSERKELKNPLLHFSTGEGFPVSDIVYSDGAASPSPIRFDMLSSSSENKTGKMDEWRVKNTIGTDGIVVHANYPDAGYGSSEWKRGKTKDGERHISLQDLFHGYQKETAESDIDTDMKHILDAQYCAIELAKILWFGKAANISLVPGVLITVSNYADDEINAMVTQSRLFCRTSWPLHIAAAHGGEVLREELRVEVCCMDYGKKSEKRFCPQKEI